MPRRSPTRAPAVLALAISVATASYLAGGAMVRRAGLTPPRVAEATAEHAVQASQAVAPSSLTVAELARVSGLPAQPACSDPVPCAWGYFGAPSGSSAAGSEENDAEMLAPTGTFTIEDISARLTVPAPDDQVYVGVMVRDGSYNQIVLQCEISSGVSCLNRSVSVSCAGSSLLSVYVQEVSGYADIPEESVLVTYRLSTT